MNAPVVIPTARLVLRKPTLADAEVVYTRYASDLEVTKYLGWPRHRSIEQTKSFLGHSDAEWNRWPAGPYLIEDGQSGILLGSTGLGYETLSVASTGYVLARDAWGHGYATEALTAIVAAALEFGVSRLYAVCHAGHARSMRVLEKCGFLLEQRLEEEFPNLDGGCRADGVRYALTR
jgi:ribosomal-protein-alanine N-acetyltransferase